MLGLVRGAAIFAAIVAAYFGISYGQWRIRTSVCEGLARTEHAALSEFIGQGHEVKSAVRIETDAGVIIGAITGIAGDGGGPSYRVYRCAGPNCEISLLESPWTADEGKAGATGERCLLGWMK